MLPPDTKLCPNGHGQWSLCESPLCIHCKHTLFTACYSVPLLLFLCLQRLLLLLYQSCKSQQVIFLDVRPGNIDRMIVISCCLFQDNLGMYLNTSEGGVQRCRGLPLDGSGSMGVLQEMVHSFGDADLIGEAVTGQAHVPPALEQTGLEVAVPPLYTALLGSELPHFHSQAKHHSPEHQGCNGT